MNLRRLLRPAVLVGLVISLLLISSTCGRGRKEAPVAPVGRGLRAAPPSHFWIAPPRQGGQAFQAATPSETTLDETLADLDALSAPEGVDERLFSELREALRVALLESVGRVLARASKPGGAPSSFGPLSRRRGTSPAPDNSAPLAPSKLASRPPSGDANRVDDLELTDNGDGTYTLTWSYRNIGDYNQDGIVDVADITPLAVHFNEPADESNEWIDGNGDGAINIQDVTPLAANFFSDVAGYAIVGADSPEGEFQTSTSFFLRHRRRTQCCACRPLLPRVISSILQSAPSALAD